MALITDPDTLTYEVVSTTATGSFMVSVITDTEEIQLTKTGALSDDGVTLQCLYSKLKEIWGADATAIKFPFCMEPLGTEQFEFINDWRPEGDTTRQLFRIAGWAERDAGTIVREYMGVITLGNIDSTSKTVGDKAYYFWTGDTSKTDYTYAGPVDEGVQIYGGPSDGNFNNRSTVFNTRIRQQGKTFDSATSTSIGETTLTYKAYRFPLAETTDQKVSESDANIGTQTPYTNMGIEYFGSAQASNTFLTTDLNGGPYNYHVVIDPGNGTAQEVYEFLQYQLRQDADIDDGAGNVNGYIADQLAVFVGDQLITEQVTEGGVALDGDDLDSNSINSVTMTDDTGTGRNYAFVAAGTISWNANLENDSSAIYRMFFTTNPGGDYGTASAILVDDGSGTDISGTISGSSTTFDFAYDTNTQGGRSSGTDAAVTVVAIGTDTGQFVSATHTITRTVGQSIVLTAPLERTYSNP